jgi:hypothetical protein
MILCSSALARRVLHGATGMLDLDLTFVAFAAALLLGSCAAWAIALWLVEKRLDDSFQRQLNVARREAERRQEEQTADPLKRR